MEHFNDFASSHTLITQESNKDTSLLSWFSSLEQPEKKKENFVSSLAAYAIISHLLLIKDRHNGNILLDFDGNIVHIDFGFILGIAPGNQFSLETAPFKFTSEMVQVLGGKDGDLYFKFMTLFTKGFLALQPYGDKLCEIVKITADGSSFPCFQNKTQTEIDAIIDALRKRFNPDVDQETTVSHCYKLVTGSKDSSGTLNYDRYQYYSQGYLF
jgi:phosphatidylinositol 4-kinase